MDHDSILILAELPMGILRGVYIAEQKQIRRLLFEDWHNAYSEFKTFHGPFNFTLDVDDKEIKFSSVVNFRNGEPRDANDSIAYFDQVQGFKYQFPYVFPRLFDGNTASIYGYHQIRQRLSIPRVQLLVKASECSA